MIEADFNVEVGELTKNMEYTPTTHRASLSKNFQIRYITE